MLKDYSETRQANGRFGRHNPGGGAHVAVVSQRQLKQVLQEDTTTEQVLQAKKKLFELGMAGDTRALQLWLEHSVGKPIESVNITSEPQTTVEVQWDYFPTLTDGESETGNGSSDNSAA